MPGVKPSEGLPFLSTPWSSRRTPTTLALSGCVRPGAHLIQQARLMASTCCARDRRAGPDLDRAGALHLRADPLHELAHRKHHAAAACAETPASTADSARDARTAAANLKVRMQRIRQPQALSNAGSRRADQAGKALFPRRPAPPSECRALSISGKLARNARARVTTPETPKPMSSARS